MGALDNNSAVGNAKFLIQTSRPLLLESIIEITKASCDTIIAPIQSKTRVQSALHMPDSRKGNGSSSHYATSASYSFKARLIIDRWTRIAAPVPLGRLHWGILTLSYGILQDRAENK